MCSAAELVQRSSVRCGIAQKARVGFIIAKRVQCSSEVCSEAQGVQCSSIGCSVAQMVQRGSAGCSLAQQGAALIRRLLSSLLGLSVAQQDAAA
jgi:hypothetical protein